MGGGELLSDVEPATISRAIEKSLAEKELTSRKAEQAYETVNENYSSEAMAARYLEFYNTVLATP